MAHAPLRQLLTATAILVTYDVNMIIRTLLGAFLAVI